MQAEVSKSSATSSWARAVAQVKEQKRKPRLPTAARLLITIVVWVVVAFAGAGIFYGLESPAELAQAAENAYIEESAGLRQSEWRQPAGVGCFGHPVHCSSITTEAECDGKVVTGRENEFCYWCSDASTCIKGGGSKGGKGGGGGASGSEGGGPGGGPKGGKTRRLSEASDLATANTKIEHLTSLLDKHREVCKQAPPTIEEPDWTFPGSLYYSFQVITTVGYGSFAPTTPGGHAATILFGGAGIAVTGYTLGIFTAAIDVAFDQLYRRLMMRRYGMRHAIRFKAVVTSLALIAYLLLVALYAMVRGGWDFGSAIYFVFVTVSTVGLGDLTLPRDTIGDVVLQFLLFYPGLALFAEFVALGNEASRVADAAAAELSRELSLKAHSMVEVGSPKKAAPPWPAGGSPGGTGGSRTRAEAADVSSGA